MNKSNTFYCYSSKLAHFIRAFDVKYLDIGINVKSRNRYYVFEKSERLDKIINLYNQVKHSVK